MIRRVRRASRERNLLRPAGGLAYLAGLGFGVPGVLGTAYFAKHGEVWTFMGFPTYGDGPFEKVGIPNSAPLIAGFVAVCTAEVVAGTLLWRGKRSGRWASHALLPFEAAYWVGFALPFGPPLGLLRTAAVIASRRAVTA